MIGNRKCAFAPSAASAIICSAPPAIAANFDGNWSMAAVTTRGHCGNVRPNSFYGWIFRFLRDSVGRPRFCLGACPDECSGWPAHRPWDRTVRAVSRQRDLGGSRALRSLPTAPNAHFLHGGEFGARYPDRRHASPLICLLRRDWRSRWRGRRATVSQLAFRCRGRRSSPRATISSKAHSVVRPPRPSTS